MLRRIKLYGRLAKFIGHRVLEADVATAAEAVRFLLANWPELEQHMADQHYRVSVGSYALSKDELHDPAGQQDIRIVPVVAGAGATGRIIIGTLLVVAAIAIPGLGIGLAGATVTAIGLFGGSLVLGGVAQLLTPVPKTNLGIDGQDDPRRSYSFSNIQNTSRAGVPVPILYGGPRLVGSVVISAGIYTVQVAA